MVLACTMQRFLPANKVSGKLVQRAIIADGCIITDAHIDRTVTGIRSVIESGTTIRNSVIMGADFYPEEAPKPKSGNPPLGIGRHCRIEGAIIDTNARIGEGAVITSKGKSANAERRRLLHSRRDRRCAERRRDLGRKSDLESGP